ncbi:MAG: hypothetical protein GY822_00650 [Deltaproteobacteria bacterium]|nr:hypothetical protein [Deltaproteobacteria bacterium]
MMLHNRLSHPSVFHLAIEGPYGPAESAGILEYFEELIDDNSLPPIVILDARKIDGFSVPMAVVKRHAKWASSLNLPPTWYLCGLLGENQKIIGAALQIFSLAVRSKLTAKAFSEPQKLGLFVRSTCDSLQIPTPDYWMFQESGKEPDTPSTSRMLNP